MEVFVDDGFAGFQGGLYRGLTALGTRGFGLFQGLALFSRDIQQRRHGLGKFPLEGDSHAGCAAAGNAATTVEAGLMGGVLETYRYLGVDPGPTVHGASRGLANGREKQSALTGVADFQRPGAEIGAFQLCVPTECVSGVGAALCAHYGSRICPIPYRVIVFSVVALPVLQTVAALRAHPARIRGDLKHRTHPSIKIATRQALQGESACALT